MKLKLDLHPIYSDSRQIEESLISIIDEAIAKRASEVEIIPGKGSGALKKTVLRFLDRPEIKAKYHRIDKDSDNFGRLFVHFRHETVQAKTAKVQSESFVYKCFCCDAANTSTIDEIPSFPEWHRETYICGSCDSPNAVRVSQGRLGLKVESESGYEAS